MRPNQAEVAALLAAEKVLSANIRWRAVGHERYRLEAKVLVPITGVLLTLAGNKGKRNFSFVLLYANYAICKATKHY